MKKPLGVYLFGILYLVLGLFVVIGFIYLLATDFAAISVGSYNAGDVEYSAYAADFMVRYALGPAIFIGGLLAIPGSLLVLIKEEEKGYYLMLLASVAWTLPIIGFIVIWYFLKDDIKSIYL